MGVLTCLGAIIWRESYAPILLERKAAKLRAETGNTNLRSKYDRGISPLEYYKRSISRPMKMLIFSPTILALAIIMGLAYAYFYLLFTTFTPVFEETYHFRPNIVGLSYLGVGVGYLLGQITYARLGDLILKKMAAKRGGELKPEYRLPLSIVGGFCIPIGFFWYGWSAQAKVFWFVPIIGTAITGFGISVLFVRTVFSLLSSGLHTDIFLDWHPSIHNRCVHSIRRLWYGSKCHLAISNGDHHTSCRPKDVPSPWSRLG